MGTISFDGMVYENIRLVAEEKTLIHTTKQPDNLGIYLDYPSENLVSWILTDSDDNIKEYKVFPMESLQRIEAYKNLEFKEVFNENTYPMLFHGVEISSITMNVKIGFPVTYEADPLFVITILSDNRFIKVVNAFEKKEGAETADPYTIRSLWYIPKSFIRSINLTVSGNAKLKPR